MRTKNFNKEWKTAMDWWRSQGTMVQAAIRRLANLRIVHQYASVGQGISSSDTNYEVFHLWKEYKSEGSPDTILWVRDKLNVTDLNMTF